MSAPAQEHVPVNVLEVAQRILESPTGMERTTRLELVALAAFALQANELPIVWPTWSLDGPALKASLAALLAEAVQHEEQALRHSETRDAEERLSREAFDRFYSTFNTIKTRFNQEFPIDGNR